jgi:hypothetical protein
MTNGQSTEIAVPAFTQGHGVAPYMPPGLELFKSIDNPIIHSLRLVHHNLCEGDGYLMCRKDTGYFIAYLTFGCFNSE